MYEMEKVSKNDMHQVFIPKSIMHKKFMYI
jgi:hypothetical protein